MLPIYDAFAEDLLSLLAVGEARVVTCVRPHHGQQILALRHLPGEDAAEFGQFVRQLHQLVTEFPMHRILAEGLVDIVEDPRDPVSLVSILDLHDK